MTERGRAVLGDNFARGLARERGDFAFQLAHAGFAGVFADELAQRGVGDFHVLPREAVFLDLARDEIALGDLQFFGLGVAGQFDDFQPVAQRGMNRLQPVGRGDEQHARQIERQIEVMVGERVVLRRIEHFQQRRRRVAAKIRADLVQFVEQNDRVAAFDAAQRLDDASGHRADVGAAVTANFRLVAHAAERDARELAAQRIGHAFAERGFADAGRADEAEDRAFDLLAAFDDGDEFEQPVLDLGEAEMLLVQNFFRRLQIQLVLGGFFPRQAQNPVEIIACDGVFGGGGRRLLQAFEFLLGGLARLVGHGRLLDFFAQRFDFAGAGSPSPSSRWMARICSRRKKSRCVLAMEEATSL